ncbi:TonB-dependent receptor [Paenirhodobacter sp.]|uniref:TonB-dependent receptor n=1 Tax=Paenirhodobacter sp. TaxID=1965326 RepID=UPI003B3D18BD
MNGTRPIAAFLGSVSLLAATVAVAQDGGEIRLDEIVIYGDRTTTNIDDTTASVAIVGQQALTGPLAPTWTDAFRQMANVRTGDWTESGFVIRGVNSEGLTPGGLGAPLASFYIDGVQQTVEGTRRGLRGTFDTEQLEVYRGPQSTLTGRAALAGAIYLRTKDPEFARSGAAQLTYGSDARKQVGLAFGDAIGSNLAFRISGEYARKDSDLNYPSYRGYKRYDDLVTDEYWNWRAKLLWLPTGSEATRVLLSYSRSYDRPTANDIAGSAWPTRGKVDYGDRRGDLWGDIWPIDGGLVPPPYNDYLTNLAAFQDVRSTTVDNFGAEITHEINSRLTLTAATGWSRAVTNRHSVNSGTPGELIYVDGAFDQKLLSQEVRLNYDDGANLRWVLGAYAAREDQSSFRTLTDDFTPLILGVSMFGEASRNSAKITNHALFGEVAYGFAPGWTMIAGGRLDHIKQEQKAALTTFMGTTASDNTFRDTVLIPKVGLKYDISGTQSVALIYQEGYRPGGAGIKASDGSKFEYDPERARNIELSWRGRFMADRLHLAANVFHQNWDSQQVELWEDPANSNTSYIANAGKSKSWGAELEMAYRVSDLLYVTASAGLLKTEFKDFSVGTQDYSGLSFAGAPERNVSLGLAWGAETGWFASGNVQAQSSMLSRLENNSPLTLGGFGTVDVAVGYGWDRARVTVYATNLFDREYFTYETGPGAMATLGDRREVGVRLDARF